MATIHIAYLVPTQDLSDVPDMGLAYLAAASSSESAIAKVRAQWSEAEGRDEGESEDLVWGWIVDATNQPYGGNAPYALYCIAQDD